MACGHRQVSRIALRCPTEAKYGSFYIVPEGIAANEPHIHNKICRPTEDLGSQEAEVRSGEMCGPCQVATGKILDDLVRDVDGMGANSDERWMITMAGGLDTDSMDHFPENALEDLVRDLDEAITSNGGHYTMSGEQYSDVIPKYPSNPSNDFEYGDKEDSMNDITLNMHTIPDEFSRKESRRTYEDTVMEWLNESHTFMDAATGYQLGEEILRNLSKPSSPVVSTECSSCRRFKRRGTLVIFQEDADLLPTSDSPYQARYWPILAKLQSDGTVQDEEGGLLSRIGWVCCEKCGARMHLL